MNPNTNTNSSTNPACAPVEILEFLEAEGFEESKIKIILDGIENDMIWDFANDDEISTLDKSEYDFDSFLFKFRESIYRMVPRNRFLPENMEARGFKVYASAPEYDYDEYEDEAACYIHVELDVADAVKVRAYVNGLLAKRDARKNAAPAPAIAAPDNTHNQAAVCAA